jgi:hypothetical protein
MPPSSPASPVSAAFDPPQLCAASAVSATASATSTYIQDRRTMWASASMIVQLEDHRN